MPKENFRLDHSLNNESSNDNKNKEKYEKFESEYKNLFNHISLFRKDEKMITPEEYEKFIKLQNELTDLALNIFKNSYGVPITLFGNFSKEEHESNSFKEMYDKGMIEAVEDGYTDRGNVSLIRKIDLTKFGLEKLKNFVKENITYILYSNKEIFDDDIYFNENYWGGGWSGSSKIKSGGVAGHVLYRYYNSFDGNTSENRTEIDLLNGKYKFDVYDGPEDIESDEDNQVTLLNGEHIEKVGKELYTTYWVASKMLQNPDNRFISMTDFIIKKAADKFYNEKYGINIDEYDSHKDEFSLESKLFNSSNFHLTVEPLRIAKIALFLGVQPQDILDQVGIKDDGRILNDNGIFDNDWDISTYKGRIEKKERSWSGEQIGWKVNRYDFLKQRSQEIYDHAKNYNQKNKNEI